MTFSSYWSKKLSSNPHLKVPDTQLRITVESLRSELKKAYDLGRKDEAEAKDNSLGLGDIHNIFGG